MVLPIDPVVSSTIITSVLAKLSFAAQVVLSGMTVMPNICIIVVGSRIVAVPLIDKSFWIATVKLRLIEPYCPSGKLLSNNTLPRATTGADWVTGLKFG